MMATECRSCPPYVVRCAHLEGDERVVWLVANSIWSAVPCVVGHGNPAPWRVTLAPIGTASLCAHPGSTNSAPPRLDTNDRAEADAAFERFESILLGRESE